MMVTHCVLQLVAGTIALVPRAIRTHGERSQKSARAAVKDRGRRGSKGTARQAARRIPRDRGFSTTVSARRSPLSHQPGQTHGASPDAVLSQRLGCQCLWRVSGLASRRDRVRGLHSRPRPRAQGTPASPRAPARAPAQIARAACAGLHRADSVVFRRRTPPAPSRPANVRGGVMAAVPYIGNIRAHSFPARDGSLGTELRLNWVPVNGEMACAIWRADRLYGRQSKAPTQRRGPLSSDAASRAIAPDVGEKLALRPSCGVNFHLQQRLATGRPRKVAGILGTRPIIVDHRGRERRLGRRILPARCSHRLIRARGSGTCAQLYLGNHPPLLLPACALRDPCTDAIASMSVW
ncbi:hypothetical protein OBBRIDRAFT_112978 [Obba rivulosa]|uniref:Uncharacterized protein n=1 Tax=Obba rivulosa TaxID=1052685 RepID=A0A8E2AU58_9APHY|nr:hypothetical protein OBBRIDRAFT_112978 [Obba rivulosa]